ncbi:SsgA family sporulation/cell division regulator [Nonomuraea sp. 3-1Str]|uniref:SsgA family sporulation/cell division regulator n=1 Tax=Nonomuraea sp. 3-1Str TaxID=2929801 RepID=UPI002865DD80|nr:SsgA family sporulation/cell division regulator [Nonomuraea sp. 3-1Str]MDR8415085.1 SsgA family sporulation/cell division regulator [Nonomuraea sp. 3-1Str]
MSAFRTSILLLDKERPDTPLAATLTYTSRDPYAVELALLDAYGDELQAHVFARSLLADGLSGAAGQGDVRVGPVGNDDWLVIELSGEELRNEAADTVSFFVAREQVVSFVARSYRLVPKGLEHEWIDWDREIASVLGGAA